LKGGTNIIEAGMPVGSVNPDQSTVLMWVRYNGHTAVAAYLLGKPATGDGTP